MSKTAYVAGFLFDATATIPNLKWLVPMACSATRHDWPYLVQEKIG